MPMLTLQMNLYHGGKEDTESDQKLVHERVIEVPVPSQPEDGQSITLEDCLTAYFDNQVVVERFLSQQMSTLNSTGSFQSDDSKVPVRVDTTAINESQPPTPQVDSVSQDIVFPSSPSRLNGSKPDEDRSEDTRLPIFQLDTYVLPVSRCVQSAYIACSLVYSIG